MNIFRGREQVTASERRIWERRPAWLAPLLVGVVAASGIRIAEHFFAVMNASWLPDGFRIHEMTANNNFQNLDVSELNSFGFKALWYDHIYPPLMDAVRFLLMQPESLSGEPSGTAVDLRLYWVFAVLYGLVAAIVYLWIRDLTRNGWWALAGSVLWCFLPSSLVTMTLLEPTPAAIPAMAGMFYLLYRFLKTRNLWYATGFFAVLLVASLVRNVVQIHVLVILVVVLISFWLIARKRSAGAQILNCILVALIFFWPMRAFVMYDTFDVSTHTGYHRAGALWIDPRTVAEPEYPARIITNTLVFSSRFNTQDAVKDNFRLSAAANQMMIHQPMESARRMLDSLRITVPNALLPVTSTTRNAMVDAAPWRAPLDLLFSGWRYLLLILGSAIMIVWSRGRKGTLQLLRRYGWFVVFWVLALIPVAFSNRFWPPGSEDAGPLHTEAARLKGLIDIPVYVLLIYAVWLLVARFVARGARTPLE